MTGTDVELPNAWTNGVSPGLLGAGLLVYEMNILADDEPVFEAWYTHEHMPERVGVPGFGRGRRYLRTAGSSSPQHLTIYEAEDPDVFASRAYLERLDDPTWLTREVLPRFRDGRRVVLRAVYSRGVGAGAELTVVRAAFRGDMAWEQVAEDLLRSDARLTGFHVAAPDEGATRAKSATAEGRSADEGEVSPGLIVLAEGTGGTAEAARKFVTPCADGSAEVTTYALRVLLT